MFVWYRLVVAALIALVILSGVREAAFYSAVVLLLDITLIHVHCEFFVMQNGMTVVTEQHTCMNLSTQRLP